ncbi:putative O-glycosylation ligase, exosortase A system-associated [Colwellia piezophila]|uniref:putative O-glycosylation ligase, exosortase A system-associated n=1 Tax=Colwellia piezophila TaxID=211668 RepID=UPI000365EADD|nr:putative O-glycosylation ligase, exosortase A system-associated [Colwellia piezophila]
MTDLIILFTLLVFIIVGFAKPQIAIMGYLWIDLVTPQKIAYGFMAGKPLSMVMAIVCILSFIIHLKKLNSIENKKVIVLLFTFAIWITLTTSFSLFPEQAWAKWDWAFKTIVIMALIPFTIKNNKDLEALIWVFLLSVAFYTISAGAKTALGGGGYGARLISGGDNNGLSESSTLALVAVVCLPLLVHFFNNTLLLRRTKSYQVFIFALICTAIFTVIGSYARTGLIGLALFGYFMFIKSKHKFGGLMLLLIGAGIVFTFAPEAWFNRMGTIENSSADSSALGRIVVWKWTVEFASSHIFGGGFNAYLANLGLLDLFHDNQNISFAAKAKAFHSIYFEVLGEHGFIGLAIYLSIILTLLSQLKKIAKTRTCQWELGLSKALSQSLLLFCVCGAFVGVAFQPIFYILTAFVVSLSNIRYTNE